MSNKQESNITDKRTLEKMLECLNNAKTNIFAIEIKATAENINAVAQSINMIQIVANTVIAELQCPEAGVEDSEPKSDI